jgi:hypothetical protein
MSAARRPGRRLDWASAGLFFATDPGWRAKVFVGGAWLALCPPVGWFVALGYRKALIDRLWSGASPVLPPWSARASWGYFADGVRAGGVIVAYLVPALVATWLVAARGAAGHGREALAFALAVVALPPVGLPLAPLAFGARYPWFTFGAAEAALVAPLYAAAVFAAPAGFLRVSRTGRFASALNVAAVARLLRRHRRAYVEAWALSLGLTGLGVIALPLAPWGVFWSYLGIVYGFNEILARSVDAPPARDRSWFDRPSAFEAAGRPGALAVERVRVVPAGGAPAAEVWALRAGPLRAPLPSALAPRRAG